MKLFAFLSKLFRRRELSATYPKTLTGEGGPIRLADRHSAHVVAIADSANQARILATQDFLDTEAYQALLSRLQGMGFTCTEQVTTAVEVRAKYGHGAMQTAATATTESTSTNEESFRQIILEGVRRKASDVRFHIRADSCAVMFKINGYSTRYDSISRQLGIDLCSTAYHSLSDKHTFERGKGTFSLEEDQTCVVLVTFDGTELRLRFQSLPELNGLDVNFRIPPEVADKPQSLSELGFNASAICMLERSMRKAGGGVAVTGPVGSGKTTTLDALMYRPAHERDGYWGSFEDTPERQLWGVSKFPTEKIGAAKALRASLRLGLDVAMIGEIRNKELGALFSELSETGQKCLTTLHVNGANLVIARLTNETIGLSRQEICDTSKLAAIVYQRLIPRLCPHCSLPAEASLPGYTTQALQRLGISTAGIRRRNAAGCGEEGCESGRAGRVLAYEIIECSETYLELMRQGRDGDAKAHWRDQRVSGFNDEDITGKTIFEMALLPLAQGLIDPYDFERLLGGIDAHEVRPLVSHVAKREIERIAQAGEMIV